jgi:hypothetical protein
MRRLLKTPLRLLWRLTAVLRRPLVRKLDRKLIRLCREELAPALAVQSLELRAENDRLYETLRHIQAQLQGQQHVLGEMSLALDSLIRELVRLQMQVEALPGAAPSPAGQDRAEAG